MDSFPGSAEQFLSIDPDPDVSDNHCVNNISVIVSLQPSHMYEHPSTSGQRRGETKGQDLEFLQSYHVHR